MTENLDPNSVPANEVTVELHLLAATPHRLGTLVEQCLSLGASTLTLTPSAPGAHFLITADHASIPSIRAAFEDQSTPPQPARTPLEQTVAAYLKSRT